MKASLSEFKHFDTIVKSEIASRFVTFGLYRSGEVTAAGSFVKSMLKLQYTYEAIDQSGPFTY